MEPNTKMTTQNVSILFKIVHPFVLVIEGHLFFGANTICNSQFLTAVTVKWGHILIKYNSEFIKFIIIVT